MIIIISIIIIIIMNVMIITVIITIIIKLITIHHKVAEYVATISPGCLWNTLPTDCREVEFKNLQVVLTKGKS